MFLGFVQLDSALLIPQLTKSGDLPVVADAAPSFRIYGIVAGTIQLMTNGTGTLPVGDQTGFYRNTKTIAGADGYVAGQSYTVLIQYAVSAVQKGDLHTFTVF